LGVLPSLDEEEGRKGQYQQHDEDGSCVEDIFIPFAVLNLHVVPLDIVGSIGIAYLDWLVADLEKLCIRLVLTDEVIPEVLVLERYESLACEMG
jgi:hypothetical protein